MALTSATIGCKSLENIKGTLTKSEDKVTTNTHEDYLSQTTATSLPAATQYNSDSTSVVTDLARPIAPAMARVDTPRVDTPRVDTSGVDTSGVDTSGVAYSKNYDQKMGVMPPMPAPPKVSATDNALQVYNQKIVDQYKEMDQLGEVVLYEINIIDKTWSQYAQQYKMASANERDQLARELSRLDDNKLILYKAYTRIYKQGRADWPAVKKEVEQTLLATRGLK
ncbi:hypothetical protein CLV98_103192 [Dyadobacter jejuensis]|uniref:Uncharacterized protein n=2 Tax=Dyadobacter jejuensis TaxID=1082580 RepID=A0A316AM11_9BACT|nr:hypothetical protein CLV98_103192 [Dyadobacter jejuensis]